MHNGRWQCEFPGTAAALPKAAPSEAFRISPDSSYRTGDGSDGGTYLLLGRMLTFTSGPFNGKTYEAQSANTVLQLDANGRRTGIRCVRAGSPTGAFSDAPSAASSGN